MKSELEVWVSDRKFPYTGRELRNHFVLSEFGKKGSAIVAWRGACEVPTHHLVDWEDRLAEDRIDAGEMVHFIGEFFESSLREAVWMQRLFIALLKEVIEEKALSLSFPLGPIQRRGDDLFWDSRKLTVSIVAPSLVSQLLHVGVNVDPAGASVPAVGLRELLPSVEPLEIAREVLERFADEVRSVNWAICKVRSVQ